MSPRSNDNNSDDTMTNDTETGMIPPLSNSDNNDNDNANINNHHSGGGSSVIAATFNFTNSIIGAGAIGLGGAIALSGGIVSILCLLTFGYLTKASLDLVIRLSIQHDVSSYEDLAAMGFAQWQYATLGRRLISSCKLLYSFGCLVAYIVVIKDNLGPALQALLFKEDNKNDHDDDNTSSSWMYQWISSKAYFTWSVSTLWILPLCLLRDMTPLASFSVVSVLSMAAIVGIVIYMYFEYPDIRIHEENATFYTHWIQIRPGILESLGTFVFTFVSQHTVHLVFGSLQPQLQTLSNWKYISTSALGLSTTVSLTVGIVLYGTFWQSTQSDIFDMYPTSSCWLVDLAKLLLCITMILTFPLPFFTCRELLIVMWIHPFCDTRTEQEQQQQQETTTDRNPNNSTLLSTDTTTTTTDNDLQQPLLSDTVSDNDYADDDNNNNDDTTQDDPQAATTTTTTTTTIITSSSSPSPSDMVSEPTTTTTTTTDSKYNWLFLPNDHRQLQFVPHIVVTVQLWIVTTGLAIAAPNLGDVLDLVGCATGAMIAFIIPGILSFQLQDLQSYRLACLLVFVGISVGTVGTFFSLQKLWNDL